MKEDVRFKFEVAVDTHMLTPVTVSDDLKKRFLKKIGTKSLKLLPFSIIASAAVFIILVLIKLYLEDWFFTAFYIGGVIILALLLAPVALAGDIFVKAKAIRNQDYEFYEGEIEGMINDGYSVRGLKGLEISPLIGKKDYEIGDKVTVARIEEDCYLISE